MLENIPNPCPVLQNGKAIGASEHQGFVNVFNWIVNILCHAKDELVTKISGRTGDISIVAGTGIDITASGNTITIGLGNGKTTDDDNPDGNSENGDTDGPPNTWDDSDPSDVSGKIPKECLPDDLFIGHDSGMFKWDSEDKSIGVGGCMVGRKWYTCTSGIGSGKGDGTYQLQVTIGSGGGVSLTVVMESTIGKDPTTTQCWIPIYEIVNGEIENDYRGAFVVPCYD